MMIYLLRQIGGVHNVTEFINRGVNAADGGLVLTCPFGGPIYFLT